MTIKHKKHGHIIDHAFAFIFIFSLFYSYLNDVTATGEGSCVYSAKMDIQIIVDTSASVKRPNFKIMMQVSSLRG